MFQVFQVIPKTLIMKYYMYSYNYTKKSRTFFSLYKRKKLNDFT